MNNPQPIRDENEAKRLQALRSYDIIDMLPEAELDAITRLAAAVCGTPMALITLIEQDRQWFASNLGLEGTGTDRDISFCQYTIQQDNVYEVNDAEHHELFENNPFVTSDPNIRFYAGAPLVTPDGFKLGALCVLDSKTKNITPEQRDTLQVLSKLVMSQFELRKKRKELEEQIHLYHRRVEDVGDIIYTSDIGGNFTFINRKVKEILGYAPKELIGTNFRDLIVPGWRERVADFYANQMREKRLETSMEFPIITKEGTPRWVEQTVTMYIKDGRVQEFHGVVRDIEERKINEQRLIESEEKFYGLFSLSPVPMALVCMENGLYTEVNDAFVQIMGYERSEVIGRTVREMNMFSEDTRSAIRTELAQKQLLKGKEIVVTTRQGKTMHVMLSTEMLEVDGQEHLLSIYHDITQRKELELELVKAKELAEQTAVAKEQFLANMSHEIRTPMNAVLGFTDLLAETDMSNDQREYLESIQAAGKNLMTIINDILDYSKIEAGMMTLEESELSIRGIFDSLEMMFFPRARQKDLQLVFEYDENIPEVLLGDPVRLTQIIINLVNNGIKFTEQGGVKVIAWLVNKNKENAAVVFQVHDTGIGIPENKIASVFDRFNQVSNDTTRKYGGTGLGLSIVKKLVELQAGQISVSSQVDKGSVFEFSILFKRAPEERIRKALVQEEKKVKMRALNILLVEDNLLNQKLAGKILNNLGHTVEMAENGKVAVDKIRRVQYDIVLMDMQMPEMDGYEAAVYIRKQMKNEIPIIAMTAHAMSGEREKCIKLGMNDYIAKPFKATDLEQKINKLVGGEEASVAHAVAEKVVKTAVKEFKFINLDNLQKLANGDNDFKNEVLEIFATETPQEMDDIQRAIEEENYAVIKSVSHKFISSIALLGLKEKLHLVLVEMENLAKAGKNMKRIKELNEILQHTCLHAVEEARQEMNGN